MNLDIGCGRSPLPGYTGVDVVPEVNPDICAPMWDIPLPDSSVNRIFSAHALEHVAKNRVVEVLREWKRLLAPNGTIEIRVPDLVWCCTNWLQHQTNDWHMDTLFGNQQHPGEFHHTGFTRPIMEQYLQAAGLKLDRFEEMWSHSQNTLVFHCSHLPPSTE